jgi:hypothetical protein
MIILCKLFQVICWHYLLMFIANNDLSYSLSRIMNLDFAEVNLIEFKG